MQVRPVLLITLFLIIISILLSANTCYASKHRKRSRYELSLGINFSNTASPQKVYDRMCKNYKLDRTMTNFIHETPRLIGRFRKIEIIRMYSYVCRIKITDILNPNFKVYNLKVQRRRR